MPELRIGQKWRHKKRGGVYTIAATGGELQCSSAPEIEVALADEPLVIYQHERGGWYVRREEEFLDGRFELISEAQ